MIPLPEPKTIAPGQGEGLRVLFVAKHANWTGELHPDDGSHAIYHREIREILETLPINLRLGDSYSALFDSPEADFVFPLLNRGGFLNSEMLLPLLCTRHGIPYLGSSTILRGVSDDKHLTKMIAASCDIPMLAWATYRRGQPLDEQALPKAERYVVKPNASSASWGVSDATDWRDVREKVEDLHDQGHDAIVEPFIPGDDIEVSMITSGDRIVFLPTMIVEQFDPEELRTYQEKRNLTDEQHYEIKPFDDAALLPEIEQHARRLMGEFMPFDYGRFEMRMDRASGKMMFLEINLNCNLWSQKTISKAAQLAGWEHPRLIEHILAESLERHGLIGSEVRA